MTPRAVRHVQRGAVLGRSRHRAEQSHYGSESGTLVSETSGREYHFKYPFVQIIGPIPRVDGLREGMAVGFDVGWTSRGLRVTVIRVY